MLKRLTIIIVSLIICQMSFSQIQIDYDISSGYDLTFLSTPLNVSINQGINFTKTYNKLIIGTGIGVKKGNSYSITKDFEIKKVKIESFVASNVFLKVGFIPRSAIYYISLHNYNIFYFSDYFYRKNITTNTIIYAGGDYAFIEPIFLYSFGFGLEKSINDKISYYGELNFMTYMVQPAGLFIDFGFKIRLNEEH